MATEDCADKTGREHGEETGREQADKTGGKAVIQTEKRVIIKIQTSQGANTQRRTAGRNTRTDRSESTKY